VVSVARGRRARGRPATRRRTKGCSSRITVSCRSLVGVSKLAFCLQIRLPRDANRILTPFRHRHRGQPPIEAPASCTQLRSPADARSTATTGIAFAIMTAGRAAQGCRPEGSAIGIMAPVVAPKKRPVCRGKGLGGPRFPPFGVRDALVCLPFAAARSTATRGHGLRSWLSVGLLGVHDDDHGPVRRSPETAVMQVKMRAGAGPSPLGAAMGSPA
jgi:hypothetical protein